MTPQRVTPKVILVLRWVARIWSLFLLALLLLIAVLPDPNAVAPVPLSDWVVLGLLVGGALLGLLVAWVRELAGGLIVIAGWLAHTIGFRVARGEWMPASGILVQMLLFLVPAVLFLICGYLSRPGPAETPTPAFPT